MLHSLQGVVSVINVDAISQPRVDSKIYDITKIDFDLLKPEFAKSNTKNTSVQSLKEAVERQLKRMVNQNPSCLDYYTRYQ